jgi:asparagine synthase (glutamine-hydrolysing)
LSGIAALIRFDGGNPQPGQIEALTTAMTYRGPDGIAHWHGEGAALGHGMLHTTLESLEEVQPLTSEDESLVLVMDGTLSNWEELRGTLLDRGVRLRSRSDAELVLHAFLARDHAGLRPLHYYWDGAQLIVASDIAGVLAAPGLAPVLNQGVMAEAMAGEWLSREETIWEGVQRPLPAHWIRFSAGRFYSGCYWQPPLDTPIARKRDEDHFVDYRAMFADCVRRSSRSHLPLACEVSGGLDSSAVFAMAHRLQGESRLPAPEIRGYSFLASPNSPADEIGFARMVAAHVGVALNEVPLFLPDLAWFTARGLADRDIPPFPNIAMFGHLGEALTGDGCRVALNGQGGDEWLDGTPFYYHDHLAQHDWRGLGSSLRRDAASIGLRQTAWRLLRHGLGPALPAPMRRFARGASDWTSGTGHDPATWLAPQYQQLLQARRSAEVAGLEALRRIDSIPRRMMAITLNRPFNGLVRDYLARQSARLGYEPRSPMQSRRFIEFAFSTPEHLRLRGPVRKFIHARALAGLLPQAVAERQTKAYFDLPFERLVDSLAAWNVDRSAGNEPEPSHFQLLDRLCQVCSDISSDNKPLWNLWGTFGVENLLRAHHN